MHGRIYYLLERNKTYLTNILPETPHKGVPLTERKHTTRPGPPQVKFLLWCKKFSPFTSCMQSVLEYGS